MRIIRNYTPRARPVNDPACFGFAHDPPEKIDQIEAVRRYAGRTGDAECELFHTTCRMVHGSKDSGGTYGLHVLGGVCHQVEDDPNLVAENPPRLDEWHAGQYRRYTDLLHETATRAASGPENFSEFGNRLATLRPGLFPRSPAALGVLQPRTPNALCLRILEELGFCAVMRSVSRPFASPAIRFVPSRRSDHGQPRCCEPTVPVRSISCACAAA